MTAAQSGGMDGPVPTEEPAPGSAMARNRDKALMLVVTLARMGVGLITFVLLARYLGPQPFGLIAVAMAYATFIGILTDYGLATSAMRTAAADPDRAGEVLSDAISVKLVLAVGMALLGLLVLAVLPAGGRERLVQLIVFVGVLAFSFGDLALVAARARRRFGVEARLVLGSSVVMLLAVGGVAAATGDVVAAAIAFAVTRVAYLAAVLIGLRHWLGIAIRPHLDRARLIETGRRSGSYAVDNVLTTLTNQLDVLLFGLILSAHEMGVYQAGSRLVQVIVPFAVVLSSVYLPSLVAALGNGRQSDYARQADRMTMEFTGLAMIGALGFALLGPMLGDLLYGAPYAELRPLWAGFGIFVLLRFTAAAFGIQLVAQGAIRTRVTSQLVSIGAMMLATFLFLPGYGLDAAPWLLAGAGVPVFVQYGLAVWLRARKSGPASSALLFSALGTVLVIAVIAGVWVRYPDGLPLLSILHLIPAG